LTYVGYHMRKEVPKKVGDGWSPILPKPENPERYHPPDCVRIPLKRKSHGLTRLPGWKQNSRKTLSDQGRKTLEMHHARLRGIACASASRPVRAPRPEPMPHSSHLSTRWTGVTETLQDIGQEAVRFRAADHQRVPRPDRKLRLVSRTRVVAGYALLWGPEGRVAVSERWSDAARGH